MKPFHVLRTVMTFFIALGALSFLMTDCTNGQQMASPRGSAELALGGGKVTIDYGRPYMKSRKIMGGLVPYGQVWRTGANKATHLTTEVDLTIGGAAVPKGTYTLFTVPSETGWKLIINKTTGQWGIPYKPEYEKTELARVDMKVDKLPAPVEQFTIALEGSGGKGVLKMEWENTRASVPVVVKK